MRKPRRETGVGVLSVAARRRLVRDLEAGYSAAVLADRFGLSATTIGAFARTLGILPSRDPIARGESFCVGPEWVR